jgi:isoleucyl-tRNA synthetase
LALRGPLRRPARRPEGLRHGRVTDRGRRALRASRRRLDDVGEEEGTGIVHIAPGCGAEDFALGKAFGLPMIAPLDDNGIVVDGFGSLSGRDVRDVTDPIVEHLRHEGRFYRLEPYRHRYPHCWRCGTPLVFRLVDEWYISMGPVYDKPRSG